MTVGEKIKMHRKRLNLTQEELGGRLGVKKNAVSKWECGRVYDIPASKIRMMAELFDIRPSELIDDSGDATPTGQGRAASRPFPDIDLSRYHRIPILGRISAGLPLHAEQNIEGYTMTDLNGGAEYFALKVKGDSMNAIGINDGYTIIVRVQDQVENGEVAVVLVGSEDATVKRFYTTDNAVTLMPQSTNPAHMPQIYDPAKTEIKVLGKAVKVEFTL